ncbi:hypothetical protein [Actinoplanes italicus]|nr:hypothetical protein [Actinoplanes italicus]
MTLDRESWERRWSQVLSERPGVVAARPGADALIRAVSEAVPHPRQ